MKRPNQREPRPAQAKPPEQLLPNGCPWADLGRKHAHLAQAGLRPTRAGGLSVRAGGGEGV